MRVNRSWVAFAGVGCAAVAGAFVAGRLWAAGIPSGDGALTYSGTLEDASGVPATGEHPIDIRFYSSTATGTTPVCQTPAPTTVKLIAGRFSIPLPDACTTAVHANPNLWVQVLVDGTALGTPTKLGAVPYALEAAHATSADSASNAVDGGTIASAINTLQQSFSSLSLNCQQRSGDHSVSSGAYDTGSIAKCNSDEALTGANCASNTGRAVIGGINFPDKAMQCVLGSASAGLDDFVVAQAICCKL